MESKAHVLSEKMRTRDVSSGVLCDFESLLLSSHVYEGLKKCGFVTPSPIQAKAIPLAKCGVGKALGISFFIVICICKYSMTFLVLSTSIHLLLVQIFMVSIPC